MKAIRIHEDGGPEVLRYEDVPDPSPAAGEVLIGLRAASLNHLDVWVRRGLPSVPKPRILGADGAGVVEDLGDGVEGFEPGQRVVINPGVMHNGRVTVIGEHTDGTHAELIAVPATNVYLLPDDIAFAEAAAFPLVFETAYRMLATKAGLHEGEWVLVWGIGGGVATAAFQIAKALGATRDRHLLERREAGARERARRGRHRQPRFGRRQGHGDRGNGRPRCGRRRRARRRGHVAHVAGRCLAGRAHRRLRGDHRPEPARSAAPHLVEGASHPRLVDGNARGLRGRLRAREERQRKVIVDSTFPLAETRAAHERLEAGEQFGKIVLRIPGEGRSTSW